MKSVHSETGILINRPLDEVAGFCGDTRNLRFWGRGVAKVEQTSVLRVGVGYTFDTDGYPHGYGEGPRCSYGVMNLDSGMSEVTK